MSSDGFLHQCANSNSDLAEVVEQINHSFPACSRKSNALAFPLSIYLSACRLILSCLLGFWPPSFLPYFPGCSEVFDCIPVERNSWGLKIKSHSISFIEKLNCIISCEIHQSEVTDNMEMGIAEWQPCLTALLITWLNILYLYILENCMINFSYLESVILNWTPYNMFILL